MGGPQGTEVHAILSVVSPGVGLHGPPGAHPSLCLGWSPPHLAKEPEVSP